MIHNKKALIGTFYFIFVIVFLLGVFLSVKDFIKQSKYAKTTATITEMIAEESKDDIVLYKSVLVSFTVDGKSYNDVSYFGNPYLVKKDQKVKGYYLIENPDMGFYDAPTTLPYSLTIAIMSGICITVVSIILVAFIKTEYMFNPYTKEEN